MASRSQHSGKSRHYGAPLSTPKPGQTTRKRPQVGDKDPNYKKPSGEKKTVRPKNPATVNKRAPDYPRRDYRGVDGAVEDAEKGKKK